MSKLMQCLSQGELAALYDSFVLYRDRICVGSAEMSVAEFYQKHWPVIGFKRIENGAAQ
ncbi:hypothetical protein ABRE04_002815 [Salmonella enterica]